MSEKRLGELARFGAVAGWALVIYLWTQFGMWYVFALYLALHLFEAFTVGLKKGRAAGFSTADSMLYTFIFGFTWWKFL